MKVSRIALIALSFLSAIPTAFAGSPCARVNLAGVYEITGNGTSETKTYVRFAAVPYMLGAFRVSRVSKNMDSSGGYTEIKVGIPDSEGTAYSMAGLSERSGKCAIAWYNPDRNDFEFNLIVAQTPVGDLGLGGDFETEEVGRLMKQSR